MLESPFHPDTQNPREYRQRLYARNRLMALLLLAAVALLVQACGRRPPPTPPPTSSGPGSAEGRTSSGSVDRNLPAPELSLRIEPPVIHPGESALLTWESRNADRVVIEPAIGAVETSGRIKFFPDGTTTYTVKAEGPGGGLSRSVTVEVRSGSADTNVDQEDIQGLPLTDQFAAMVKPIFFDFDSATLSDEARLTLDGNIRWLERPENRALRILLEGHCDERGTEEYNLALGDERAAVVRDYLVARGMEASRVTVVSLGEERLFDTRRTEEGYALNRRTQFVLVGEQ